MKAFFAAVLTGMQNFWRRLTNTKSLTSSLICAISATLVFCGHVFWLKQQDIGLLFAFFCSSGVLMIVYAFAYGIFSSCVDEFDGGLVSARFVIRFIAVITSISFLVCGVQLESNQSLDPLVSFLCMAGGPAVLIVFAITYAIYANNASKDRKWRADVQESELKGGPARNTLLLLEAATAIVLLYCAGKAGWALEGVRTLGFLIALALTIIASLGINLAFHQRVPPKNDRGVRCRSLPASE